MLFARRKPSKYLWGLHMLRVEGTLPAQHQLSQKSVTLQHDDFLITFAASVRTRTHHRWI